MHEYTYTGVQNGSMAFLSNEEPTEVQIQATLEFYDKVNTKGFWGVPLEKPLPFIFTDTGETILTLIIKNTQFPSHIINGLFSGYSSQEIAWLINYKSYVPGAKAPLEIEPYGDINRSVINLLLNALAEADADIANFDEIYNNIPEHRIEAKDLLLQYHNNYEAIHSNDYHELTKVVATPIADVKEIEGKVVEEATPATMITGGEDLPEANITTVIGDIDVYPTL